MKNSAPQGAPAQTRQNEFEGNGRENGALGAESHEALSSIYQNLRLAADNFGRSRAEALATGRTSSELEQDFFEMLRSDREFLTANEDFSAELLSLCSQAQSERLCELTTTPTAEARAQASRIEKQYTAIWEQAGEQAGRAGSAAKLEELEQQSAELIAKNESLFKTFPQLGPELLKVRERALSEGQQRYLRADLAAINLFQAMHWSKRESARAH